MTPLLLRCGHRIRQHKQARKDYWSEHTTDPDAAACDGVDQLTVLFGYALFATRRWLPTDLHRRYSLLPAFAQVNAVPVTSPFFAQPYQQAIRSVITTDGRGVMFRIPANFFNNPQNFPAIDNLATVLGVARDQVDILIDLQYRPDLLSVQQVGEFCLNSLPLVNEWRTVTLASGSFSESTSNQPTGQWIPSIGTIRSSNNVSQQRTASQLRLPSYGDYGIRCGGKHQVIPNTPAPNLRYAGETIIWVRRGDKSNGSMRAICGDLIAQQFYSGAQFSVGNTEDAG